MLVHEHLPQIAGPAVAADVLARGNRSYRPPAGDGYMPIEFGGAAYRFGHSMVRPSYRANFTSGSGDSSDFDFGDGQVKNNKRIDPTISSVLFTLPLPALAPHTQNAPTVLPQRTCSAS